MKGLVAYLTNENEGSIKLILDDVTSRKDTSTWNREELYTCNDYDYEEMVGLNLTQEQFSEIGQNLVFRLLALNHTLK